MITLEVPLR